VIPNEVLTSRRRHHTFYLFIVGILHVIQYLPPTFSNTTLLQKLQILAFAKPVCFPLFLFLWFMVYGFVLFFFVVPKHAI
jgi:hypothetical protein